MNASVHFIKVFCSEEIGYEGNTSAVLFYEELPHEVEMQKIAADFNQPASTFIANGEKPNQYHIRWFAPDGEIGLCGHGTAAALAFFKEKNSEEEIELIYKTGVLKSHLAGEGQISFEIDAQHIKEEVKSNEQLENGLGVKVIEHYRTENKNIVLVEDQDAVMNLKLDFGLLASLPDFGYIITAKGKESDIVCRTIVPKVKQLEDPATGSSHATITPFWTKKLNVNKLVSRQLSERGGLFYCELTENDKVRLTGNYETFSEGVLLK